MPYWSTFAHQNYHSESSRTMLTLYIDRYILHLVAYHMTEASLRVCTHIDFTFPTNDESTYNQRQAYVQASLLAKTRTVRTESLLYRIDDDDHNFMQIYWSSHHQIHCPFTLHMYKVIGKFGVFSPSVFLTQYYPEFLYMMIYYILSRRST